MTDTGAAIDTAELDAYLSAELGVAVAETEVIHDGLNLSIAISTEEDGRAYVLRRPNKFRQRETFNDITQEYGVLERLRDTAVAAPDPVLVCDDDSVLGGPFLVMTHLEGEAVPLGSGLPERFQTAPARDELATRLVETLADVHSVDVEPFSDVCDRRTVGEQLDRVTDQLDAATRITGHEPPGLWDVADWLRQNVPADAETTLVHGDYRPANVLFDGTDRPDVAGVLDWETATLGDPLTELGYLLLRWRDDGDPTPPLDELRATYPDADALGELEAIDEDGLAPFTNRPGSPSRRELVSRYEDEAGISFENERFYRAFAAFVLATVWEDLHRHSVEAGAESDWEPRIDYVSMIADDIASGELRL